MKQTLTAQQVTENLKRLFTGKEIECTEVIAGNKWDDPIFYIQTKITQIVIIGKMIWIKPNEKNLSDYIDYCSDFKKMYLEQRTKIGLCIPFIYLSAKESTENKKHTELLLVACGLKTAKNTTDDSQRLRQLGAKDYVNIYKLIKEVEVIDSNLVDKEILSYYGLPTGKTKLMLSVTHTKGNFQFQIENITGSEDDDNEIQNIFLNLLGKPVTSKVSELVAA